MNQIRIRPLCAKGDGLGPEQQPSLESGLYVPRVTDWNLKMMPKKTNLMPEILMKSITNLKKPVFWIFLAEGTCGVTQRAKELSDYRFETDLQADLRGSHGGLPFSRNFCQTDQICPEFLKEILKTLTQKATYYTLSVTSWTSRRPQPLFLRGKKGEEIVVVMANMYLMMVENNLKNLNTPVLNELVVKRNEPTERHFILG